jgi:hypothetical protein
MKEYITLLLLIIGFWWSPAWLIAWVLGRKCSVCELRAKHGGTHSAEVIELNNHRGKK